ncbi:MAG: murein biosynthesis integral membrane protein MurJ [Armatimonadota bacterium]
MAINIAKVTGRLFFVTSFSRILQILSAVVIAASFGTSRQMDTYQLAFSFSEIVIGIVIVALNVVFIPVYWDIAKNEGNENARDYFNNLFFIVIVISIILAAAGIFVSPLFARILPGYAGIFHNLFFKLMVIAFILLIPRVIAGMLNNFLNATKKFIAPAVVEIPMNLLFIMAVLFFKAKTGIYSLAIAVALANLLSLILLFIISCRKGLRFKWSLNIKIDKNIIHTAKLSLPILLAAAASQINVNVDKIMASFLPEGSISTLFYAKNIRELMVVFIIIPIAAVVFPFFSEYSAGKANDKTIDLNARVIKVLVFLLVPATFLIIILAKPLVRLVYEYGAFDSRSVHTTSIALMLYSLGIFWMGINYIIARVFYALKENTLIFFVGIFSILSNILLNLILMRFFFYAGIALSTSIVETIVTIFLLMALKRKLGYLKEKEIMFSFFKIFTASLIMSGVLFYFINMFQLCGSGFIIRFLNFIMPLAAGLIVYILLCILLKVEELAVVLRNLPFIGKFTERR